MWVLVGAVRTRGCRTVQTSMTRREIAPMRPTCLVETHFDKRSTRTITAPALLISIHLSAQQTLRSLPTHFAFSSTAQRLTCHIYHVCTSRTISHKPLQTGPKGCQSGKVRIGVGVRASACQSILPPFPRTTKHIRATGFRKLRQISAILERKGLRKISAVRVFAYPLPTS